VPYETGPREGSELPRGVAALSVASEQPFLAWPTAGLLRARNRRPHSYFIGATPLFGRLADDTQMREWLRPSSAEWRAANELRDERGTLVSTVWRRDDGSTFLPFDPNELIEALWYERYLEYVRPRAIGRLAAVARTGYYRARPFLPRNVQMGIRRSFSRVQSRTQFPRWPIETALHDLYELLFGLIASVTARPIPYIGPWPRRWSWALVLTHDVEAQVGYDNLSELLGIERELDYRSSWNFVPQNRYVVEKKLVESLTDEGFEIGVHGLYHDGRDLSSAATLRRRLPAIRAYAELWRAVGFRSPATLRSAELMPLLGFDYDSSYSDTAPFEPQAGGCCTWLPYMLGNLVELPITVVQDHTLFELLEHRDATVWLEKARFLRQRGGMALFLTHSDYVANGYMVDSYRRVLEEFADDQTAWKALPREVSDWWRRRSESRLEEGDGEWRVVGPATDDAAVEFMSAQPLTV
jgi:hypothetical protein